MDKELIKSYVGKLEDKKLYSTKMIVRDGVIVNTLLNPSPFTLYRLIKNGTIPATNLGTGKVPRYHIRGKHLKKFLTARYIS